MDPKVPKNGCGKLMLQRFRVRHGLSCMIGPVWPVGGGCYSQVALPMPLPKPLYNKLAFDANILTGCLVKSHCLQIGDYDGIVFRFVKSISVNFASSLSP